ncbi:MAG: FimD/PapC N-terminal domain-containing protein [Candidatus Malihini olakiniferum]
MVLSQTPSALASTETPQYKFDDALFLGSDFGHVLYLFKQNETLTQGDYLVDIWLNRRFISRKNVLLRKETHRVEPCLPLAFYQTSMSFHLNNLCQAR